MRLTLPVLVISLIIFVNSKETVPASNIKTINKSQILEASLNKRTLENNQISSCTVKNCLKCTNQSSHCESCASGFTLNASICQITNKTSDISMSLLTLTIIITSLAVFFLIFCVLCFYFAHRNRPRYSEAQFVNHDQTKSSISFEPETASEVTGSSDSNLNSPQNNIMSLFDDISIRLRILNHLFRSLPILVESEDFSADCAVCFSSMKMKKLKKLQCEHAIHYGCCKNWILAGNNRCPVCFVDIR